jgi:integrase
LSRAPRLTRGCSGAPNGRGLGVSRQAIGIFAFPERRRAGDAPGRWQLREVAGRDGLLGPRHVSQGFPPGKAGCRDVADAAHRLRKQLRLGASAEARTDEVRALTQDELDRALAAARTHSPKLFGLYLVLARCGLRIGEALGLDDTDPLVFDFDNRRLRVRRQLGRRGTIETPKSGHGRDVDLSLDVVTVLKAAIAEKKKAKLSGQFAELPRWTFTTSRGTPHSPRNVLRAWYRLQAKAGLLDADGQPRFDLKALRHTFASLRKLPLDGHT